MLISRKSPLTGLISTQDLPVTVEQMRELASPKRRLIQEIVPDLSPAQREFLLTGYTEADWAVLFPPEDGEAES